MTGIRKYPTPSRRKFMDDAGPRFQGVGVVFAFIPSQRWIVNRWPALSAGNRSDGLGPYCRR
jgi:hypothetical protein